MLYWYAINSKKKKSIKKHGNSIGDMRQFFTTDFDKLIKRKKKHNLK